MEYKEFKERCSQVNIEGFTDNESFNLITSFTGMFEKMGLEEEIVIFYPQGIFVGSELNLFFFTKEKFYRVKFIDKHTFNIETFLLSDIKRPCLTAKTNSLEILLTFKVDEEEFEYNSILDTNSSWASKFKTKLEDIYEFLTKAS